MNWLSCLFIWWLRSYLLPNPCSKKFINWGRILWKIHAFVLCIVINNFFWPILDVLTFFKQSAVHQSFAVGANLGEISAKAQVSMCISFFFSIICISNGGLFSDFFVYFRSKQCALTSLVLCLLHLSTCV